MAIHRAHAAGMVKVQLCLANRLETTFREPVRIDAESPALGIEFIFGHREKLREPRFRDLLEPKRGRELLDDLAIFGGIGAQFSRKFINGISSGAGSKLGCFFDAHYVLLRISPFGALEQLAAQPLDRFRVRLAIDCGHDVRHSLIHRECRIFEAFTPRQIPHKVSPKLADRFTLLDRTIESHKIHLNHLNHLSPFRRNRDL